MIALRLLQWQTRITFQMRRCAAQSPWGRCYFFSHDDGSILGFDGHNSGARSETQIGWEALQLHVHMGNNTWKLNKLNWLQARAGMPRPYMRVRPIQGTPCQKNTSRITCTSTRFFWRTKYHSSYGDRHVTLNLRHTPKSTHNSAALYISGREGCRLLSHSNKHDVIVLCCRPVNWGRIPIKF